MTDKFDGTFALTTPGEREIVLTRLYDAPPEVVLEATTRPEHVRQWFGCDGMEMASCEIDFREGGRYRYVLRAADGTEIAFSGLYEEIDAPRRIVHRERFEPVEGAEYRVTVTFEPEAGGTRLTSTIVHDAKEKRDGHLCDGAMEEGARKTFDKLAGVVAGLRETA